MTRYIDADEIRWCDHFDSDGNKTKYKVAYSDEMPPTIDAVPKEKILLFLNIANEELSKAHANKSGNGILTWSASVTTLEGLLQEYDTADTDIVLVRHGKWIYGNEFHWYTASCNRCGYQRRTDIKADRWNQWNYCPNCGCRMEKE